MRSLRRDEVRRIDSFAIETLGIPGAILMENAGRNVSQVAWEMLAGSQGRKVAVVAGSGNNGGDGLVVARHLLRLGADVQVYLASPSEKFKGDARINYDAAAALGIPITDVSGSADGLSAELSQADLVVDAVGGTGIQGALHGHPAEVVDRINSADRPVLAVDIPTGLDCDKGTAQGPAIRATKTVTFVARKAGFDVAASKSYTGEVIVADIGIPAERLADQLGLI